MKKRVLSILLIAALLFSGIPSFAEGENAADDVRTRIQAHRGASSLAPENTVAAFRAAKQIGVDGIETDIRMTRDHQLVLRHEDAVDLASNGHGNISEMTLEELKSLDFGAWYGEEYAGEKILTLAEFLELAEELDFQVLNLEMKPVTEDVSLFVRSIADTVRRSGLSDRVMVSSFDGRLLKELKEYAPEISAALLTVPRLSIISVFNLSDFFPKEKPLTEYTAEDVKDVPPGLAVILRGFGAKGKTNEDLILDVIKDIAAVAPEGATWDETEKLIQEQANLTQYVDTLDFQIDCLNCHSSTLSRRLIHAMHARGINVNVWTPDTGIELEMVLALAPDGIITNEPERAMEIRDQMTETDVNEP